MNNPEFHQLLNRARQSLPSYYMYPPSQLPLPSTSPSLWSPSPHAKPVAPPTSTHYIHPPFPYWSYRLLMTAIHELFPVPLRRPRLPFLLPLFDLCFCIFKLRSLTTSARWPTRSVSPYPASFTERESTGTSGMVRAEGELTGQIVLDFRKLGVNPFEHHVAVQLKLVTRKVLQQRDIVKS